MCLCIQSFLFSIGAFISPLTRSLLTSFPPTDPPRINRPIQHIALVSIPIPFPSVSASISPHTTNPLYRSIDSSIYQSIA